MRVTRESLIRIAKETIQQRVYNDKEKDIIAAYLTGSLLTEEPMLGGTADIDMVFVHRKAPMQRREFVQLTPDFHLDISRRAKDEFKTPRELRVDPWLGYEMYDPMLLYEREKFFDFVQASLRAGFEFEQPPLMLQRCRKLYAHARQIWMDLADVGEKAGPKDLKQYFKSLFHAVNVIAELNGPPIQERRLLWEFPARADAAEKPGLAVGASALIGANNVDAEKVKSWIGDWKAAFVAASEETGVDLRIHPARINYYEKAILFMLGGETPLASLWPLMQTWTLSAEVLEGDQVDFWHRACNDLGLLGSNFGYRVQGLDQYLDEIDILLEEIATANGVDVSNL